MGPPWGVPIPGQVLRGEDREYIGATSRVPQHAHAFASVLRLAADRIKRGESVQDVVRGMALHNVVMALSGLV